MRPASQSRNASQDLLPGRRFCMCSGYSISEMIVVISVIGILAGVAIIQIIGASRATQEVAARHRVEILNRAIASHQEANAKDNLENQGRVDGAFWDELKVLQQLQYRSPIRPTVGSPYMATNYRPASSSNTNDYRIMWTGSTFSLLLPGTNGTGLKVVFDGSDIGPDFVFPPGYKWSGR